jgi:hypothetical protein
MLISLMTGISQQTVSVSGSGVMRWSGHSAHMGENINAHKAFVRKPEETRPFGRYRCRWNDNIKINLKEKG